MTMAIGGDRVYVARDTAWVDLDGHAECVRKGTRVREGHQLIARYPGLFEDVGETVAYDVEQATAAPGEKRGARTQAAAQTKTKE